MDVRILSAIAQSEFAFASWPCGGSWAKDIQEPHFDEGAMRNATPSNKPVKVGL